MNKTHFQFGDIVYYKKSHDHTGIDIMQILEFSPSENKYRCVFFDGLIADESICIIYIEENEIESIELLGMDSQSYWFNDKPLFPINVDDNFLNVYVWNQDGWLLKRRAFRQRKRHEIPLTNGEILHL